MQAHPVRRGRPSSQSLSSKPPSPRRSSSKRRERASEMIAVRRLDEHRAPDARGAPPRRRGGYHEAWPQAQAACATSPANSGTMKYRSPSAGDRWRAADVEDQAHVRRQSATAYGSGQACEGVEDAAGVSHPPSSSLLSLVSAAAPRRAASSISSSLTTAAAASSGSAGQTRSAERSCSTISLMTEWRRSASPAHVSEQLGGRAEERGSVRIRQRRGGRADVHSASSWIRTIVADDAGKVDERAEPAPVRSAATSSRRDCRRRSDPPRSRAGSPQSRRSSPAAP